jgi:hypothetical protein
MKMPNKPNTYKAEDAFSPIIDEQYGLFDTELRIFVKTRNAQTFGWPSEPQAKCAFASAIRELNRKARWQGEVPLEGGTVIKDFPRYIVKKFTPKQDD